VFVILCAVLAYPGAASAQQSLSLHVGGFVPLDPDSRADDDVLVNNRGIYLFNHDDFNGPTVGADWLFALGDRVEGGLGIGFYSKKVPSIDADYVNENGSELEQDLKLRVVPLSATIRFLPLGRYAPVQPYIGAGVGVFAWRYSETGQFVRFPEETVFRDRFVGSGAAAGPLILGGVRFPMGSFDLGGEIRYQKAEGELPADQDFMGSVIDLGGFNYLFTMNFRF
jgi:hypothetical protein